jgi:hypothetical protein
LNPETRMFAANAGTAEVMEAKKRPPTIYRCFILCPPLAKC